MKTGGLSIKILNSKEIRRTKFALSLFLASVSNSSERSEIDRHILRISPPMAKAFIFSYLLVHSHRWRLRQGLDIEICRVSCRKGHILPKPQSCLVRERLSLTRRRSVARRGCVWRFALREPPVRYRAPRGHPVAADRALATVLARGNRHSLRPETALQGLEA